MTPYPAAATLRRPAATPAEPKPAFASPQRQLYLALSESPAAGHPAIAAAGDWLDAQLAACAQRASPSPALPSDAEQFGAWQQARHDAVEEHYKQYVAERRAGAPRRMFSGRAPALYYLAALAPARLTDGAWLYGALTRWDDPAMQPLVSTYLEELGRGVPDKNHVVIFQQLIDAHGCTGWQRFGEAHFYSGLAQLALAHHAERLLPEIVGYNLGMEHASLDTLVAAYELNELGIDPYYFSLHATVDNGSSGHAALALEALEALRQLTTAGAAGAAFLRRVDAGYRLHAGAPSSATLLAGFELRRELSTMLAAKRLPATRPDGSANPAWAVRIGARSLGAWLADAGQVPALLATLEGEGWLRAADGSPGPLWQLIGADACHDGSVAADHDDAAPLAGLFDCYELALLADWAAVPAPIEGRPQAGSAAPPRRIEESSERGIIRHRFPDDEHGWEAIANELSLLEARVVASNSKEEALQMLAALMSPAQHHRSTGLMATRLFSRLYEA